MIDRARAGYSDVQRDARELIEQRGFNLAVIGPFDDAARFEKLLA